MKNKPVVLFLSWLATVVLALTLPRFFVPNGNVDLAPIAGLVFLSCMLVAFLIACFLLFHSLRRRVEYSTSMVLLGASPFIISVTFFIVITVWITRV